MKKIFGFLLLIIAFLGDCFLSAIALLFYLFITPDEDMLFNKALKYYFKL